MNEEILGVLVRAGEHERRIEQVNQAPQASHFVLDPCEYKSSLVTGSIICPLYNGSLVVPIKVELPFPILKQVKTSGLVWPVQTEHQAAWP